MYLLYITLISLILPYILQTHSSQNIHTYFSYIFKLYISQSNYIQDSYPIKYLHIFLIHLTNTLSHKIYIFLTIFIHLKRYQILFQEHVTKSFSWKTYNYNAKKPFLWKAQTYNIRNPSHGRQYYSYLTKN